MQALAIDLGKQSFHIYGITDDGEVVSRKVSRAKLVEAINRLYPQAVTMEACASSHHWGLSSVFAIYTIAKKLPCAGGVHRFVP